VTFFLDASVLVAAFWGEHPCHSKSFTLLKSATTETAFCAAHTVAEVYSTMTRLPIKPRIAPDEALLFIRQIRERFTIVPLSAAEYLETIDSMVGRGIAGGSTCDCLILFAAAKCGANAIFTWNLDDFRRLASDELREKIRTP